MNEEALFDQALSTPPGARAAFLEEACVGDPGMRQRLEALLHAHEHPGSFLRGPAPALAGTVDQPAVAERPGTVIGPYKLLEQIGEGGFGVVFMAEQQAPIRRKVALKVLKPGMDTRQVIARFEVERQALALMDHPNIAHVFDGGETASGRPYFVMELVRGIPITDFCDQNHLPVRARLELFIGVCQAVQHAHQKGIIHRDIKPNNVMVTMHDDKRVVKVIDFGVAKATGQQLTDKTLFTNFAQLIGTPLYMSPEQAQLSGLDIDTRTDIFALGVLLYELLTGTTPFDKQRFKEAAYDEIRRIIREEEPPKPSTRISTLGQAATTVSTQRKSDPRRLSQLFRGELDWIVMKCLEKNRDRRYETANGLVADVQHYLNDEPVQACPPSAGYRFRKFLRRNERALTTTSAVVLTALIALGSIAGSVGWGMRDRAARRVLMQHEVTRALEEAENSLKHDKLSEALAAVKRAEVLLAGGGGSDESDKVRRWRADLDLATELQDAAMQSLQVNVGASRFNEELAIPNYEAVFRACGIDRESMTPEQAAQWIGRRPPQIHLIVLIAVDNWIDLVSRFAKQGAESHQQLAWLKGLVRAADSDPWRTRMRLAVERSDYQLLAKLADSPEVIEQAPYTLERLGRLLVDSGKRDSGIAVLRRAQQIHPGNFRINALLGFLLLTTPQRADAVRFCAIAVALLPDNAGAHLNLGKALHEQGSLEQAIPEYRTAVALKRDYAFAHHNLASALKDQGKPAEAEAAARKAIEISSDDADFHNTLGQAMQEQGKLAEAVVAFGKAIIINP